MAAGPAAGNGLPTSHRLFCEMYPGCWLTGTPQPHFSGVSHPGLLPTLAAPQPCRGGTPNSSAGQSSLLSQIRRRNLALGGF